MLQSFLTAKVTLEDEIALCFQERGTECSKVPLTSKFFLGFQKSTTAHRAWSTPESMRMEFPIEAFFFLIITLLNPGLRKALHAKMDVCKHRPLTLPLWKLMAARMRRMMALENQQRFDICPNIFHVCSLYTLSIYTVFAEVLVNQFSKHVDFCQLTGHRKNIGTSRWSSLVSNIA